MEGLWPGVASKLEARYGLSVVLNDVEDLHGLYCAGSVDKTVHPEPLKLCEEDCTCYEPGQAEHWNQYGSFRVIVAPDTDSIFLAAGGHSEYVEDWDVARNMYTGYSHAYGIGEWDGRGYSLDGNRERDLVRDVTQEMEMEEV